MQPSRTHAPARGSPAWLASLGGKTGLPERAKKGQKRNPHQMAGVPSERHSIVLGRLSALPNPLTVAERLLDAVLAPADALTAPSEVALLF